MRHALAKSCCRAASISQLGGGGGGGVLLKKGMDASQLMLLIRSLSLFARYYAAYGVVCASPNATSAIRPHRAQSCPERATARLFYG